MQRIGYLGPRGSFSEEALYSFLTTVALWPQKDLELVEYASIPQLLWTCERKEINWAFVPLENSTEGQVGATMDILMQSENLLICYEFDHHIDQCLLTPRPLSLKEIKMVYSHEQALGQCRVFLEGTLPYAKQVVCLSTAEAAKRVADAGENCAAIASRRAAKLYNLYCAQESIQDAPHNETRFILVGWHLAEMTGQDKTSMLIRIDDAPGALCRVLQEFAQRQLNLTRIESRPSKRRLGEYVFFIDVEGYVFAPIIQEVLCELQKQRVAVKLLGSYPRTPGGRAKPNNDAGSTQNVI